MKEYPEITALSRLSTARFILHLAGDYLGLAAGIALFAMHPSVISFLAASIIIGISQHALAVLGHEAVHYRISPNRTINDWIGNLLCFFPTGITVSSYRDFHFPHHRMPNTLSDPELPLRLKLGKSWVPPYTLARGLRLWALSLVGFSVRETLIFVTMLPRGKILERVGMAILWAVAIAACARHHALIYVGLWSFSLFSTFLSTLRIQGWYEHILENSERTSRYSLPNAWFRLVVPHNIWVHYEHHRYPAVPFYNLEKARALDSSQDRSDRVYGFNEMVDAISDRKSTEVRAA